ncbi:hypothetical protein [Helicobacter marmotae]|uniref:hypothetical protein n=1 Tax=Helicobacter marmotae TaxID=152490 RepID=UPI001315889F|nr:hypothetical protein [Helicobacter marmotae]
MGLFVILPLRARYCRLLLALSTKHCFINPLKVSKVCHSEPPLGGEESLLDLPATLPSLSF